MPGPNLRAETLSAIHQHLLTITDEIGRIDLEIDMLDDPGDHDRLDMAAQMMRILVDELEQRVTAMAAGR
jgi:hypothetical protein